MVSDDTHAPSKLHDWSYRLGVGAWLVAMLITWPLALSFADEVGYLGATRMLLTGRWRPTAELPGIWFSGAHGLTPKYPYFHSLVLAPFYALGPRLVFCVSLLALLGLTQLVARSLRAQQRDPRWALLCLAQPSFVVLARTCMADLPLAALGVLAWQLGAHASLEAARARPAVAWLRGGCFALICALKPMGFVLAGALLAGDVLGDVLGNALDHDHPASRAQRLRAQLPPLAGGLLGGLVALGLNWLANGSLRYGYQFASDAPPMFGAEYLGSSGLAHASSLCLCPPLLVLGARWFWQRKQLGPLLVIGSFVVLMSSYFFVDYGRNRLESLVLSQRLILPAVAFLLIGYAHGLAAVASRSAWLARVAALLVVAPACVALLIGQAHRRWQEPMARALAVASRQLQRSGERELGLTRDASKVGLMFAGPLSMVEAAPRSATRPAPRVVLCNRLESYRAGALDLPCELPGYRAVATFRGVRVLTRLP